jgi:hypothetical protein
MSPLTLDVWLEHLDYSLGHKNEFDYGTWWLAISPDGYSLLLLYTWASAGGNSYHFSVMTVMLLLILVLFIVVARLAPTVPG